MVKKFGNCKNCGNFRPVNSKVFCADCVYLKNHGESRWEAYQRKQKDKPVKIYRIKRKPIKIRKIKPIKKKKESTGEYNLFIEIWNEREHICVNCKQGLDKFIDRETGNPPAMLFSHIKTKGSRGDLRLVKKNIELNCLDCHYAHEHIGDKAYNKRKNLYKNE